jgi:hypothetical protein
MRFFMIHRLSSLSLALVGLVTLALSVNGCGGNVVAPGSGGGGTSTTTTGTTTSTTGGFFSCDGPGQCLLVEPGCCSGCGMQEIDALVAVNSAQVSAYHKSVCPVETPCPACASQPNPNLFAYCDNGTCRAADIRTHEVSACSSNADCHLRLGPGCCEACGGSAFELTAVSAGLEALVCSPSTACDDCVPQYPLDAEAVCSNGHCGVVFKAAAGG